VLQAVLLGSECVAIPGYGYDYENRLRKQTEPDGSIVTSTYMGARLGRTVQSPAETVHTRMYADARIFSTFLAPA